MDWLGCWFEQQTGIVFKICTLFYMYYFGQGHNIKVNPLYIIILYCIQVHSGKKLPSNSVATLREKGSLFWLKFFQARAFFKACFVFSLCVSRYERIECSSSGIKKGKCLPEGFLSRSTIKLRYGEIKKLFEQKAEIITKVLVMISVIFL